MKKAISILLSTILAFTLFTFTSFADDNVEIKILSTTDIHGRNSNSSYSQTIGFEKLATIKKTENPDFLIDSGDLIFGQPFATLSQGESLISLLNEIGYDGFSLGNHDFNYGTDRLNELKNTSSVNFLCYNLLNKDSSSFFGDDNFIIKEVDGVKVGVFGVIDNELYKSIAPNYVNNVIFDDIIKSSKKAVDRLKQLGCDIIIASAHANDLENLATNVPEINLILGGHTHIPINKKVGQTQIIQSGFAMNYIGKTIINYSKQTKEISFDSSLISFENTESINSDENILNLINSINKSQETILSTNIGNSLNNFDWSWEKVRIGQLPIGKLLTTAYIEQTGVDIAFENAGGIRTGLLKGNITYKDIISIEPFGNYIVTKSVLGKDILSTLEKSFIIEQENIKANNSGDYNGWSENSGSYLQFSGINIEYLPENPANEKIITAKINGKEIDKDKFYTVATNNYLATDSSYPELAASQEISQDISCDTALSNYIKSINTINSIDYKSNVSIYVPQTSTPSTSEDSQSNNNDTNIDETKNPNTGSKDMILTNISVLLILINGGLISQFKKSKSKF